MEFNETLYDARISGLFTRFQSVQTAGFSQASYKPGLEGMMRLCDALGFASGAGGVPETEGATGAGSLHKAVGAGGVQLPYRCIHVAGTNGKGSVASMLASALAAGACHPGDGAHPRVGLYTSPHLLDFRERMRIVSDDGWCMPAKEWVWDFLEKYDAALEGHSFFEITTGMAFKWFAEQAVDYAVIEVGLGGLLDSTNVIQPCLSVITSIGLDHCAILGDTREKIAAQKAGIFKHGVPAVVWGRDPETWPVFVRTAASAGCPLIAAGDTVLPDEDAILAGMDLQGPCQKINLHTSLVALAILAGQPCEKWPDFHTEGANSWQPCEKNPIFHTEGMVPGARIVEALQRTAARSGFRGRWERFTIGGSSVICDIGHNPAAIAINFERLQRESEPNTVPAKRLIMVYGIMADKDLDSIAPLMPSAASYYLVAPQSQRSLPAAALLERLHALRPGLDCRIAGGGTVREGVLAALADDGRTGKEEPGTHDSAMPQPEQPDIIYIGGSAFVVAEALPVLDELTGHGHSF